MKVYLDDIREAPIGWTRTYNVQETIELLKTGKVTELSLDHDLALLHYSGDYSKEETGYDVLLWLEEQVSCGKITNLPIISLHTANPAGGERMRKCLENIFKILSRNIIL